MLDNSIDRILIGEKASRENSHVSTYGHPIGVYGFNLDSDSPGKMKIKLELGHLIRTRDLG